jgi:hypothetical protein
MEINGQRVAVFGAAMLCVSACGASASVRPAAPVAPIDLAASTTAPVARVAALGVEMPLNLFLYGALGEQKARYEAALEGCLRDNGFDPPHAPLARPLGGLLGRDVDAGNSAWLLPYAESLPKDRAAAFFAVLNGGDEAVRGGCEAAADVERRTPAAREPGIDEAVDSFNAELTRSDEWLKAQSEWSACMRDRGVEVSTIPELSTELNRRHTVGESVAELMNLDLSCRENTMLPVVIRRQTDFVRTLSSGQTISPG